MHFANEFEQMFYQALRIRRVEEKIAEIYPTDKIQSPVHLSIGQEPIAVGICQGLKKTDWVFGTYRGHALYLAKGGDLKAMIAELFGKITGCGRGKAGSMHLSDSSVGMMGASAVVASTLPHAVGAALAAKIKKTGQVIVCFFGEGATSGGVYHEVLNFASVHSLPVLFVCENNDLAVYTKVSKTHAFAVVQHSTTYRIPSHHISDGWDIELIAEEGKKAIEYIRNQSGPILLEIKTYRYRQHVGPDEDYEIGYRDRSELDWWQEKDLLIHNTELIQRFQSSIDAEIQEAVEFAETSVFPDESDMYADVR